MSRLTNYLLALYQRCKLRVTQIRDTPHAIAGGVVIGFIIGFTPLFGLKAVLAVGIAWLLRCNKVSAALALAFHDVLFPVWPVILRWQYQLGYFIVYYPHRLPPKLSHKHLHFESLFDPHSLFSMKTFHILWPTFVGSVILAIPIAVVMYFFVLELVRKYQAAMAKKAAQW